MSEKLTAVLHDLQQGIPVVTERQALQDYLTRWLDDCVKPSVRLSTYVSYEQQVRVHISPELGRIELPKLTPQHIQKYMNGRLKTGLSAKTVKYHLSVLRMALGQALK